MEVFAEQVGCLGLVAHEAGIAQPSVLLRGGQEADARLDQSPAKGQAANAMGQAANATGPLQVAQKQGWRPLAEMEDAEHEVEELQPEMPASQVQQP